MISLDSHFNQKLGRPERGHQTTHKHESKKSTSPVLYLSHVLISAFRKLVALGTLPLRYLDNVYPLSDNSSIAQNNGTAWLLCFARFTHNPLSISLLTYRTKGMPGSERSGESVAT